MGAFLRLFICSQKRSENRLKRRQTCPGLAAFGGGRLGAGIWKLAFRRWHFGDGISAMAFRRWRFGDGVSAMQQRRGPVQLLFAGAKRGAERSLGCAARPLRFAARVDFGTLARLRPGSESRPANQLFFATALIAAKPVKPCDGGVFEAFYLLSKKEFNAAGRGRCLVGGFAPLSGFGAGLGRVFKKAAAAPQSAPAVCPLACHACAACRDPLCPD